MALYKYQRLLKINPSETYPPQLNIRWVTGWTVHWVSQIPCYSWSVNRSSLQKTCFIKISPSQMAGYSCWDAPKHRLDIKRINLFLLHLSGSENTNQVNFTSATTPTMLFCLDFLKEGPVISYLCFVFLMWVRCPDDLGPVEKTWHMQGPSWPGYNVLNRT